MKRPPLLPTLALTALTGTAVFLAATTPSCDPQADAARDSRAAQHRAFAEALHAAPETQRAEAAARAAMERERASASSPAVNYKLDAEIASRRREFLTMPEHWSPAMAQQTQTLAGHYRFHRKRWMKALVDAAGTVETGNMGRVVEGMEREAKRMEAVTLIYRKDFDRLCADLTQLTPEARRRWDRWEEKNWQGWSRLTPDPDVPVAKFYSDPDSPGKNNPATFVSGTGSSVTPLVNQLEYLEALRSSLTGEQLASVVTISDTVRKQLAAAAATEASMRALSGPAEPSPPVQAPELRDSP